MAGRESKILYLIQLWSIATLWLFCLEPNWEDGINLARTIIDHGAAWQKLEALSQFLKEYSLEISFLHHEVNL